MGTQRVPIQGYSFSRITLYSNNPSSGSFTGFEFSKETFLLRKVILCYSLLFSELDRMDVLSISLSSKPSEVN